MSCPICQEVGEHDLSATIECQMIQLREELHRLRAQQLEIHRAAMLQKEIDRSQRDRVHREVISVISRMVDLYFQAQGGAGGPGPLTHLNQECQYHGCEHAWMRHEMKGGCTVPGCGCGEFQASLDLMVDSDPAAAAEGS